MKKAIFVTGATIGTGLATAKKFASEGYAVFITSRDVQKAEATAKAIGEEFGVMAKGYGLGIRDEEAVKDGRFALHRAEGIAYAASLFEAAAEYEITEDYLIDSFQLIRQDWQTGET